jgi:glycosyltransferase involved in cell wall biosynthesis
MGGLSINEAMAFGKPVICSVCDGTERDLVTDSVNGLYFKPDDVLDLAEKIQYLILHPELMKRMGEESQRIIREKININTVTERFAEAFQKVYNMEKKTEGQFQKKGRYGT